MSPPTDYRILWEINPWMNIKNQPNQKESWRQWHKLFEVYQKLGIRVFLIPLAKNLTDMVFTANAGWGRKGSFVLSNFKYSQRKREEKYYKKWFESYGFKVFFLPKNIIFEGQADVVTLREAYLFGHGVRTTFEAQDFLQKYLKLRKPIISLRMVDERFFHLDTCLFYVYPIDTIIYYPAAFDEESREKIKRLEVKKIEVTEQEAKNFICNGIYYEDTVVLNKGSQRIAPLLRKKGLDVVTLDSSEFQKAGGGVRCLTLFLD